MRYATKIELPVTRAKQGQYVLSKEALCNVLAHLATQENIINLEWEDGNCFVTVEMYSPVDIELPSSSFELFVDGIIRQNSRKN